MSRIFIFDSLRAHLKARSVTYKQLAEGLGVSEPTIKRIFSANDCTMERLSAICHYLQIEMTDLVRSAPKKRKLMDQLTCKQEQELVDNKKLLMVAICVMAMWSFQDMLSYLKSSRVELTVLLHRLERIGFIELHPQHRYRLLVARNFSWLVGGPIMQMIKGVSSDFFDHRFEAPGEVLKIINVRVSQEVRESLKARLEQIAQEYADQVVADSHLPLEERPPLSICIAVREWVPEFLQALLKVEAKESVYSSGSQNRKKT